MVANTEDQTRKTFKSTAETLGELKRDFDANGINYEGLDITEGISKTQLIDDSSQLPTQVTYKGSKTNNLVILITRTKKKTASGAMTGERGKCYEAIKNGNLQDAVKEVFGKNFTMVSTADLNKFLEEHGCTSTQKVSAGSDFDIDKAQDMDDEEGDEEYLPTSDYSKDEEDEEKPATSSPSLVAACLRIIDKLVSSKAMSANELLNLIGELEGIYREVSGREEIDSLAKDLGITNEDIDAMIASL